MTSDAEVEGGALPASEPFPNDGVDATTIASPVGTLGVFGLRFIFAAFVVNSRIKLLSPTVGDVGVRADDVGLDAKRHLGLGTGVCLARRRTSDGTTKAHGPRESNTIFK